MISSKRVGIRDLVISLPFRSLHFDGDASYWSPLNTLQQMSDFYAVILLFGFLLDVMHFFIHLFVEVIPKLCAVLLSDNLGGVLQTVILHISHTACNQIKNPVIMLV